MNEMNEDNSAHPSGENIQPLREELVTKNSVHSERCQITLT